MIKKCPTTKKITNTLLILGVRFASLSSDVERTGFTTDRTTLWLLGCNCEHPVLIPERKFWLFMN